VSLRIRSTKLGDLESVVPEDLITFQEGILGFPDIHRYLLIQEDSHQPFLWLQAATDPELAFFVIDPLILKPDYRPGFSPLELRSIDAKDARSLTLLSIVTVPQDDPTKLSANLMAPLVINHLSRKGRQIVLNNPAYALREPILQSLS